MFRTHHHVSRRRRLADEPTCPACLKFVHHTLDLALALTQRQLDCGVFRCSAKVKPAEVIIWEKLDRTGENKVCGSGHEKIKGQDVWRVSLIDYDIL